MTDTQTQTESLEPTSSAEQTQAPEVQATEVKAEQTPPPAPAAPRTMPDHIPRQRFDQTVGKLRSTERDYAELQAKHAQAEKELNELRAKATPAQKSQVDDLLDELSDAKTPQEQNDVRKELQQLRDQISQLNKSNEQREAIRLEQFYETSIPQAAKEHGVDADLLVKTLMSQPTNSPYWDDPWALAEDIAAGQKKISHSFLEKATFDELVPILQKRGYTLSQAEQIASDAAQAQGDKPDAKADIAAKFPKSSGGASGAVPESTKKVNLHDPKERLADALQFLKSHRATGQ